MYVRACMQVLGKGAYDSLYCIVWLCLSHHSLSCTPPLLSPTNFTVSACLSILFSLYALNLSPITVYQSQSLPCWSPVILVRLISLYLFLSLPSCLLQSLSSSLLLSLWFAIKHLCVVCVCVCVPGLSRIVPTVHGQTVATNFFPRGSLEREGQRERGRE